MRCHRCLLPTLFKHAPRIFDWHRLHIMLSHRCVLSCVLYRNIRRILKWRKRKYLLLIAQINRLLLSFRPMLRLPQWNIRARAFEILSFLHQIRIFPSNRIVIDLGISLRWDQLRRSKHLNILKQWFLLFLVNGSHWRLSKYRRTISAISNIWNDWILMLILILFSYSVKLFELLRYHVCC